jgi:hypothetical protein
MNAFHGITESRDKSEVPALSNWPWKIFPVMTSLTPLKPMIGDCDLDVVNDYKGAGEPVDPDPVVPTVGAN